MDEEIVVEDGGRAGHQERLFGRLGRSRRRNLLEQELVIRHYRERAAGGLAPVVTQQLSGGGDLEIGLLHGRVAAPGFLELRPDDAVRVLLLDIESFRSDVLAFDEDAERAGIDGLVPRFVFLVRLVGAGSGECHG